MYYIHINRNTLRSNQANDEYLPIIRIQKGKYGEPEYCYRVKFKEGEVVYKPTGDPILPCGARLLIQTTEKPEIIE